MDDLSFVANASAMQLACAYRSGALRPTDAVRFLLDRIEATRGDNIFITVTAERALAEARLADARHAAGAPASLLDGVPVGWKDLFDVAGTVTTAGSIARPDAGPAATDADCVRRLSAAGMVTLGKLNTSEFAYSGLGLNPHFGTPRNPHDAKVLRSPGGSSSGSGAAVAAGLVPCAIGTDTGGSIRVPAAFNGVVGFKTSFGRIGTEGMFALSRSLDTIGPLARTVEDCALMFQYLTGAALPSIQRMALRDLVLLCPTNVVLDDLEPDVLRNFELSLEILAREGATIRREHVPAIDEAVDLVDRHGTIVAAEAYHEYHDLIESEAAALIDRRVVHRIDGGRDMSAHDLLALQRGRMTLRGEMTDQLAGALLVMPTTPNTAPEVAPLDGDDELFHRINRRSLRNVNLGNFLDHCALALPSGQSTAGLPTSIMFSTPASEDERLLGFGLEVERALRVAGQGSGAVPHCPRRGQVR